jgi:hypothetical protein
LQKTFKKEGFSSKPSDLIKELLPRGSSAKVLGDREEMSSIANSLEGQSSQILHTNAAELTHEVKVKRETKNKNSHFEGLKNQSKSEIHDFKIQKDRDSLLMKLLEEERKLRKCSVREISETEKGPNLCTLSEKKVSGGGGLKASPTECYIGDSEKGGLKKISNQKELTWDEIQQATHMIPNNNHLILGFLCFSYYLAPHVFHLILMVLNIMMFIYKNFTKVKKTYDSLYQIWSGKPPVQKLSKKEKIRKDISYVTGEDINPFNPDIPKSEQMTYKMSEKSNVPKISENKKLISVKGEQKDIRPSQKFHPVIKKIENLPRPLNFEGIERKNSDNLNQNLSLSCTAEPKMKNEKSHWIVTKNQLGSVATSSNTELHSVLERWHTRFRNTVPWLTVFFALFNH